MRALWCVATQILGLPDDSGAHLLDECHRCVPQEEVARALPDNKVLQRPTNTTPAATGTDGDAWGKQWTRPLSG